MRTGEEGIKYGSIDRWLIQFHTNMLVLACNMILRKWKWKRKRKRTILYSKHQSVTDRHRHNQSIIDVNKDNAMLPSSSTSNNGHNSILFVPIQKKNVISSATRTTSNWDSFSGFFSGFILASPKCPKWCEISHSTSLRAILAHHDCWICMSEHNPTSR